MEITKLDEFNEKYWKVFVKKNPDGKIQHTIKWKKAVEESYKNCEPYYYIGIEKKNTKFIAPFFLIRSKIFGNRLISLPFLDNGGFLGKISPPELSILKKRIIKDLNQANIKNIEIRLNSLMKGFKELDYFLKKEGFEKNVSKQQYILKLENVNDYFKKLSRNTKRMIKIAKKEKLKIRDIDISNLNGMYSLYFKKMKNFGTPQHSKTFFINLWKNLYPKNIKAMGCYKENKLIGCMICYLEKKYVYYIYSFSSLKKEYLKMRPNEFLYWKFIKWSIENDYQWFDFGQIKKETKKESHAQGIKNFKNKWKGEIYEKPIYYYPLKVGKINNSEKKEKLKKFRKIWGRLPNSFIKIFGPKIASQVGN